MALKRLVHGKKFFERIWPLMNYLWPGILVFIKTPGKNDNLY